MKSFLPFLFSALLLCCTNLLFSQASSISGVVTDDNGESVIGATVVLQGANTGVTTDIDGRYQLQVPAGTHVVEFRYVGMDTHLETLEVAAGQNILRNVTMGEKAELLKEVVVVGYGTQRRRDLTGNIVKVPAKEIQNSISSSFENGLQGRVAGVQFTQSSGVAGSGSVIRIRGVSSFSAGGQPLIIIDGAEVAADYLAHGERGGANSNPLSSINPNDIEDIQLLKDANAAAIYGAKGSNGVLIITTKQGSKTGKPKFNFNAKFGTSVVANKIEILNTQEWLQIRQEAYENDGGTGRAPLPRDHIYYRDDPTKPWENLGPDEFYYFADDHDTDWLDEVLTRGFNQEYNLSGKFGFKNKLSLYAGLSYMNQSSFLIGNSFQRYAGRINLNYTPSPRLNIALRTSIARGNVDRIDQAWAGGLGTAQTSALPLYPIKDGDGNFYNLYDNPVAQRELKDFISRNTKVVNSLTVNYRPMTNLNLSLSANMDDSDVDDFTYEAAEWTQNFPYAKSWENDYTLYTVNGTAKYDFKLNNEDHGVSVMVGGEYQESDSKGTFTEDRDADGLLFTNPSKGDDYLRNTSDYEIDNWKFASVFGRVNYDFQKKYFVNATFRRDGSTKFGANNKFANFPSIGVGWLVSEENFFKSKAVNFLKLRASWGETGNSNINWQTQFGIYSNPEQNNQIYNGAPIRYKEKVDNPDFSWEVVRTFDAGMEIGLLDDRITSGISVYNKLTPNALIALRLQPSSGLQTTNYVANVGKIRNTGLEFNVSSRNIVKGPISWSTRFNISFNSNKVLEVGAATPDALDGGFGDTRAIEDYWVSTNYIVRFSHIDQATGRPVYLDEQGAETFTYDVVNNRYPVDQVTPDAFGGLINEFTYKNFDLNVLITFQLGGTVYDDAAKRQLGVVTDWNMRKEIFDRWQEPGDNATYPQLTRTMLNWGGNANFWQNNHSLWLYDASFMRLKELRLGYNFKPANAKSILNDTRLYVMGTNLLLWTNYIGWDPEVSRGRTSDGQRNIGGTGITYLTEPQAKTFVIGLSKDF